MFGNIIIKNFQDHQRIVVDLTGRVCHQDFAKGLDMMYEEYDQEVPNLRVMLYDVSIAEALDYKKQIEQVDGVEEVI